ncbi:FecR family protein [Pedobacter heparinus]|uniref:FecR family protein n=1 Tax=Pedobacter heparinus TaxID=984 RepID=UPI00292E31B9|nr:FecR domain-containing protein [Pedobacter heparinus]
MENKEALALLEKYHKGTCTEQERAAVEAWYNSYAVRHSADAIDEDLEQEMSLIWKNIQMKPQSKIVLFSYSRLFAYAAAIVVIFTVGLLFYLNYSNKTKDEVFQMQVHAGNIKPARNGATLILANGKKIRLAEAANGELAKEAGVVIRKTRDGQLIYEIQGQITGTNTINTISTAKGETYQLRLPDGTVVWINAASSLTYDAVINKAGLRKVKLEGEAYFEVAKDKLHPFIVETDKQQVKVLGTHFNVNAYPDEVLTRTTLLEGAVQLNNSTVLDPGEQAVSGLSGKIAVEKVDVTEAVAWKNGKFIFTSEDITSVMRKLSRWYNVEVLYKGDRPVTTFTGVISRYDNISKILDKINYTGGARLTLEGRRIIVMP